MTLRTRSAVSGLTRFDPLMTRDTVALDNWQTVSQLLWRKLNTYTFKNCDLAQSRISVLSLLFSSCLNPYLQMETSALAGHNSVAMRYGRISTCKGAGSSMKKVKHIFLKRALIVASAFSDLPLTYSKQSSKNALIPGIVFRFLFRINTLSKNCVYDMSPVLLWNFSG